MRVVITGASGVLGSAVREAFAKAPSIEVLALSHSRSGAGLTQLDLLDMPKVEATFSEFKPQWVIHCAAERRPDVAAKDPEGTVKLNAELPGQLAHMAKRLGFSLVYISTDYVFDGTSPPYSPSSATNPLNLYGQTKRDGELGILGVEGAKGVVLRVPVLYGPAPSNADSAINILLDVVQDQSGKEYKMDHYQTRYPTNVVDIGVFLRHLTELPAGTTIPPILHYSAPEPFTKYEICLIFAKVLGVPHAHIIADSSEPKAGTVRPKDTQLYTRETESLLGGTLEHSLFEEWWAQHLKK